MKINKKNLLSKITLAVGTGVIIASSIIIPKVLDKKAEQENIALYGHLKNQPREIQKSYIMDNLSKDNWGYRYDHPLGFADYIKDWTVNEIIEDISK